MDICLSADDKYSPMLATTIASILHNADDEDILNLHIISNGISDVNQKKILTLKTIKECNITFYTPPPHDN
ncbi:hypothetical protein LS68_006975 [Helicobacter sp. MIT 05-5293]|uniref:hypothetical protein n=1 Tax=Helicobacter sp. MIT 05-5293 TaxID=1548149 RepID=UPI0010FF3996|nr:hypothetical protein [Helicobacter sp. MIT 05-5293]TLD80484.1 hypothetical protein LS68_006975 [Helicobacter sp. MIT 05-5293]